MFQQAGLQKSIKNSVQPACPLIDQHSTGPCSIQPQSELKINDHQPECFKNKSTAPELTLSVLHSRIQHPFPVEWAE